MIKKIDNDSWVSIEWEGDEMTLPEIFESLDNDDLFMVYEMSYIIDGEPVDGYIGFHITDRTIWKQVKDEKLTTQLCTLTYAEKHDKELAKDYDYAKREARRILRKSEKRKRKGRPVLHGANDADRIEIVNDKDLPF